MIKSMTGYGRHNLILNGRDISVEIKSVNHRFFEFSSRIPRSYAYLEPKVKTFVQSLVSRGKVDVSATIYNIEDSDTQVKINESLAREYVEELRKLGKTLDLNDDLSLSSISRFSDIFNVKKVEEDEEQVWEDVKFVLNIAVENFIAMRAVEGQRLKNDILQRLERIAEIVKSIEEKAPITVVNYRERITNKMMEVLNDTSIDEQRILLEAALYSEKIAIDEETVRLNSHLKQFKSLLEEENPVGRKLDFLVQELNRETNTIGSKAQDIEITGYVVEIKSEIEKIREQIQNIE